MNERIRRLMGDSGLHIAYDNKAVTEKELEFFAEAIVRECCEVVNFYDASWNHGPSKVLKAHFGVKDE